MASTMVDERRGVRANDDVAGQQESDLAVDTQRPVGQGRVAGAQDQVVLHVHVEFGLQGVFDVDLGEDAESLIGQSCAGLGDGLVEGELQNG